MILNPWEYWDWFYNSQPMVVTSFTLLTGYDEPPTETTTESITFIGRWEGTISLALYVNDEVVIDFAGLAVGIVGGVETTISFEVTAAEWEDAFDNLERPIKLVISDQTDPTNILYTNHMHTGVENSMTYNGLLMTYNANTMTYIEEE